MYQYRFVTKKKKRFCKTLTLEKKKKTLPTNSERNRVFVPKTLVLFGTKSFLSQKFCSKRLSYNIMCEVH